MKSFSTKRFISILTVAALLASILTSMTGIQVKAGTPGVPDMPPGAVNLITESTTLSGNDLGFTFAAGVLQNTDDTQEGKVYFNNVTGITGSSTYVYKLDITPLTLGVAGYEGPRVIYRYTDTDNYLSVGFFDGAVHLLKVENGSLSIIPSGSNYTYSRAANTQFSLEIVSAPTSVSVYVNGNQLFDNFAVPQMGAAVGMYSALSTLKAENIVLYEVGVPEPTPPSGGEDAPPVIPDGAVNLITNSTSLTDLSGGALGSAFTGGVLSNTNSNTGSSVVFNTVGLNADDTYLYEGEITLNDTHSTDGWMGPRLLFRHSGGDHQLYVGFFGDSTHLLKLDGPGNLSIVQTSSNFVIQKGQKFKVTVKSEPEKVSVWINDSIIFKDVAVPKFDARVGMYYAYATTSLENIKLYSLSEGVSDPTPPSIGEDAPPAIPDGAANLITNSTPVSDLSGGALGAVFTGGVLSNTNSSTGSSVVFNTTSLKANDTYLYEGEITLNDTQSTAGWMGPRLLFRHSGGDHQLYVGFFSDSTHLLKLDGPGNLSIVQTSSNFVIQKGQKFKVTVKSEPEKVSVWVNDSIIFKDVAVPKFNARVGMYYANAAVTLENIKLHLLSAGEADPTPPSGGGSGGYVPPVVVVQSPVADPVPVTPAGSVNLIANSTTLTDLSNGALGVVFADGVLKNTKNDTESLVVFNTEGMKANDTYMYEGEITLHDTNGSDGWKGPRLVFRQSDGDHQLNVAFFSDATHLLKLDGAGNLSIVETSTKFVIKKGQKFKVTVKSEPDKVTVWINDNIIFTDVAVPSFDANVGMHYAYATASLENIQLYSLSDSGTATPKAEEITGGAIIGQGGESKNTPEGDVTNNPSAEKANVIEYVKVPVKGVTAVDGADFTYKNGVFKVPMSDYEGLFMFDTSTLPSSYSFKADIAIDDINTSEPWHGMKLILKYKDANNWFGVMWDRNGNLLPIELKNGSYINHDATIGTAATAPMEKGAKFKVEWIIENDSFVLMFDDVKKLSGQIPVRYASVFGVKSAMAAFTMSGIEVAAPKSLMSVVNPKTGDDIVKYLVMSLILLAVLIVVKRTERKIMQYKN